MERDRASMLAPQNIRLQKFHQSQRGKKDDINFTLEVQILCVSLCVLSLYVIQDLPSQVAKQITIGKDSGKAWCDQTSIWYECYTCICTC